MTALLRKAQQSRVVSFLMTWSLLTVISSSQGASSDPSPVPRLYRAVYGQQQLLCYNLWTKNTFSSFFYFIETHIVFAAWKLDEKFYFVHFFFFCKIHVNISLFLIINKRVTCSLPAFKTFLMFDIVIVIHSKQALNLSNNLQKMLCGKKLLIWLLIIYLTTYCFVIGATWDSIGGTFKDVKVIK